MSNHLVTVRNRNIYISGHVDEGMAHAVIISLEELDVTDGTIRLVINSDGGDEACGYAMYDAITRCRNQVVADGYGSVKSIMAAVFQAADWRRLGATASFLIHNGQTTVTQEGGVADQDHITALAEQLKKDSKAYYTILSKGSQQPLEVIKNFCDDETYFTAQEAVDVGLADEVIKPLKNRCKRRKKK